MTVVTKLADFDELLRIAKKHGVAHLKLGDIEVLLAPQHDKPAADIHEIEKEINVDAEAWNAYKNL